MNKAAACLTTVAQYSLLIRLNNEVLRPAPARTYPAVSGALGRRR